MSITAFAQHRQLLSDATLTNKEVKEEIVTALAQFVNYGPT